MIICEGIVFHRAHLQHLQCCLWQRHIAEFDKNIILMPTFHKAISNCKEPVVLVVSQQLPLYRDADKCSEVQTCNLKEKHRPPPSHLPLTTTTTSVVFALGKANARSKIDKHSPFPSLKTRGQGLV